MFSAISGKAGVTGAGPVTTAAGTITFHHHTRPARPRLQLDLTKRNAKSTRKTKWTILCVGLTLLTMCVTLVGTMLSIGSQYQNLMVARKWELEFTNMTTTTSSSILTTLFNQDQTTTIKTSSSSMSPLLSILKISKEDIFDEDDSDFTDEDEEEQEEETLVKSVGYRGKKLRNFSKIP